MDDTDFSDEQPVAIEIDGTLDLHHFSPKDLPHLIPNYLEQCQSLGILQVRLIHGKGTGTLRRSVHHLLRAVPQVESFRLGDETSGGWGATLVRLQSRDNPPSR